MRITNTLFIVAAAATVGFHGCGTSANDLKTQVSQIEKDVPDLHPLEKQMIKRLMADAAKIPASARRQTSRLLSAMYKKGQPLDPISEEEFASFVESAPLELRTAPGWPAFVEAQRSFAQLTPDQRTRIKIMLAENNKMVQEAQSKIRK